MASGKRHAEDTGRTIVVVLCVIASIATVATFPHVGVYMMTQWRGVLSFVAGLCIGHYAPPDVRDQQKLRNHGEKMVEDDFGRVAGLLWSKWWEPMAERIPHRHWASHLPGVATVIAAAWLYWLPLTVLWWYGYVVPVEIVCWHVVGWSVQDTVHLMQDGWKVRW